MGRTHTIALRLRNTVNWASNTRNWAISSYLKHVFQKQLVGEPGIRSSTTGIWVNVTLWEADREKLLAHPLVKSPFLDFRNMNALGALGRMENRIVRAKSGGNQYYTAISKGSAPSPMHLQENRLEGFQIFRDDDKPIRIKFNFIQNPLLSADILAQYVSKRLSGRERLAVIYKNLLKSMG
ncbi:uncharacterized protein BJ171DRAFT_495306 [Polychytrium aggregatum]|uniref:uncharacterized protein n=1 Tax=Polychytrium aggregatum TaxID=110093 RepID=UPI0022FE2C87|nr:uncharacterized protein BJ171DRAFT_495306 [Polychytrium aggregatum]KAI9206969.1 hypothetical protein BJ171DRAFT_495306 [Polychytrium aggregatum]